MLILIGTIFIFRFMCVGVCGCVFTCMHMNVYTSATCVLILVRPRKDRRFFGTGVTRRLGAIEQKCRELDSGHLEKQQVLLIAEPSLYPQQFDSSTGLAVVTETQFFFHCMEVFSDQK